MEDNATPSVDAPGERPSNRNLVKKWCWSQNGAVLGEDATTTAAATGANSEVLGVVSGQDCCPDATEANDGGCHRDSDTVSDRPSLDMVLVYPSLWYQSGNVRCLCRYIDGFLSAGTRVSNPGY